MVLPSTRLRCGRNTRHQTAHLGHENEHARARLAKKRQPQMEPHYASPGSTDAVTSCPEPDDSEAKDSPAAPQPIASQHATLKYSLLGPSLTKAGQDSVDQSKVGTHVLARCFAWKLRL